MNDSNGNRVTREIRKDGGAWGVNVWFGSVNVTDVRRYYYATRKQAIAADISDDIGKNGRVR